ncbi:ATP/GTP-binding protein [Streptomyces sp. NPDC059506]|uniref:GTP-binding protein n=1 Tax=Streptomyces sp. NPDC059506 TaxID=3347751 RepID=UPI0036C1F9D2
MDYAPTDRSGRHLGSDSLRAAKVVVVGPLGVGKTTLVGSVSEIAPLRTEETMTRAGEVLDDLASAQGKDTTTVAMDFGRMTLSEDIVLYLFGAPGQPRFRQMLEGLLEGALGGVIMADTRRLEDSFPSMDRLEEAGVPYAVAVNHFDGAPEYSEAELRDALDLHEHTPLQVCDARNRASVKAVLIALIAHLMSRPSMELA